MNRAKLQGAYLQCSSLFRSHLYKASLQAAYLDGTILNEADLTYCSAERASFINASLNKTKLYGCKVEMQHPDPNIILLSTAFGGSDWWNADFTHHGKCDDELKNWLQHHFSGPFDDF